MRGSIKQRFKGSWTIRLDAGCEPDPKTGLLKRKQHTLTIRGTRKDAEDKLGELLGSAKHGMLVEPSKITLGQWLAEWLDAMKPSVRNSTYVRYKGILDNHLSKAPIAALRLQKLRSSHLEGYYA